VDVTLEPAYEQCTSANRAHGPPLAFPSFVQLDLTDRLLVPDPLCRYRRRHDRIALHGRHDAEALVPGDLRPLTEPLLLAR
jgi:hypothetical protein